VERAPLFRGLDVAQCRELLRDARDQRVLRKKSFFAQGDPAVDVMLLCAGRLKLTQVAASGAQLILRLTGPGEVFGAVECAGGGTYPVSAVALEPSHALVWKRETFGAFAEQHPVLLRNSVRIVSQHMRSLEERCGELATQRVPQRVAQTLLRLVAQIGQPVHEGVLVSLTREELAQIAGTTLFSVSRLFGEWESKGLVKPRREGVVVTDAQGLARLIDGTGLRAAASGLAAFE
jgi:CRP-like cAMP-binding protein